MGNTRSVARSSLMAMREPQGDLRDFVAWALGAGGEANRRAAGDAPLP